MKHLFFILLITSCLSSQAQDKENKVRAESLAAMAVGKEAEGGSMEEVSAILEQAVKAAPSHADLYAIWGFLAMKRAEKGSDAELYEISFEKFNKSVELKQSPEVYGLWAGALIFYANLKKDESVYEECFDKLQKAIDVNPRFIQAYLVWGQTLLKLAMDRNDAGLYRQSIEKYNKVLELDANSLDANTGKGYACLSLGKIEKDHIKYEEELVASYLKAEQQGSQSAAYNLACYYSLVKEKEEAHKWLEKTIVKQYTIKMDKLDKKRIEDDQDFNNIRRDKKYKEILSAYFN
ncbi:tetratricopeptide repeat protein [Dysgonomonas termitidis]|uniref:Tetratricopeptide repeat protein n=1 Tax=Dysgonomonas termitidis TaxID=1516126 RepID=A0ABV9KQ38_9BACT